jgi:hypothetical protein
MEGEVFEECFDAQGMNLGWAHNMTRGPSWKFRCLDCRCEWIKQMNVRRNLPLIECPDCDNEATMPIHWRPNE